MITEEAQGCCQILDKQGRQDKPNFSATRREGALCQPQS